jgi:hypothetical protein
LDEVKVGFVGRDTNGWAGFYGPEVRNINFRLNYGIDPCYEDPLSSTSCAGFQEALLELQCNGDPLSSIDCPGYLENFMSEIDMNLDEVFEDEMYDEYSEEELYEDEFIADEEFLDDEELLDEDLIADEEFLDEDLSDGESVLSLLKLIGILNNTDDESIDSLSQYDSNTIMENQIVETITSTNISIIKTDDIAEPVKQENIIRVEITQLTEQSVSSDSLIAEIADQDEKQVEDTETIVDETLIAENDTEEELETIVAVSSSSSNINETNIETLLSDTTVQENNTETVVVVSEQISNEEETSVENIIAQEETNNNEETTNDSFDDITLMSEVSLDVVITAASTFNNSMQQVLALGGTITEILNTPVPDFSRFEIKPPSQDEEVQTAKVENTLESMSAEEIESQAELRIGSMDPESQAIALQLIGYKPGFDQYGGTIQDQQNWYQSTSVYSNNRVPTGSNQLFGAQDQRHQELMSLQYRR